MGKYSYWMSPYKGQVFNLEVRKHFCATELPNSEITNTEVIFHTETFHSAADWWFHSKPNSQRTPQAPRAVPQAAGRRQQRPASGSLGHIQAHQVLCACGIPANLKIDVLFSLLLTGQPCTVKTRRRLDWEFWLYVLCKPKYGTHKPCSAGALHPYQWLVKSCAINER